MATIIRALIFQDVSQISISRFRTPCTWTISSHPTLAASRLEDVLQHVVVAWVVEEEGGELALNENVG